MKHAFIFFLFSFFTSSIALAQDTQQIYGLKSFEGETSDWGKLEKDIVVAQKGFVFLKIDKYVLVLPEKLKEDSKKIVSEFLSSGHSTGLKSKDISVFGWNIEEGSAYSLGTAKSIVAQAGDGSI